jgi:hypothetical protein
MAKLLYVEPSDEITDLVDRIRRAEGDRDLVFVVPPDGHVLRTPLDMRLLMQYTRGFQKRIAIVSGDPQIQTLAIRTGFPTFPSLARLEQGAPLGAVPALAAEGAAGATPGSGSGSQTEQPKTSTLARRGQTALVAAGAAGAGGLAGWRERFQGLWHGNRSRNITLASGAGVFLVGLLLVLFLLPSATVTLGVPAHKLTDTVTIQGSNGALSGKTLDQISTKALQTTSLTKNFTVTPTGTQALAPVPATGNLEFCGTKLAANTTLSFSGAAPNFVDSSTSGVSFTTTTAGENQSVTLPDCTAGFSQGIAVQADASTVGTQGNVGASETWTWPNFSTSGCLDGDCAVTLGPAFGNVKVTNQQAMTGGKAAATQSVFSTTDASTAQQQEQTVDLNLTKTAEQQLKTSAGSDVIAEDSGGKGIQITVTNPTLPTGCNTSASTPCPAATAQTLTVTVTAAATAYSPAAARAAVLQDLKSKVPAHAELLADPSIPKPQVATAGAGGAVTLTSRAVGYWAQTLNLTPLQSNLAFKSPSSARSYLLTQLPKSSSVSVKQSPFGLPWLPIFSSRIHLVRVSIAQGRSSG